MSDAAKVIFMLTSNNQKLNKYMLLHRGNFGHEGKSRVLRDIKNEKNYYFVVDTSVN